LTWHVQTCDVPASGSWNAAASTEPIALFADCGIEIIPMSRACHIHTSNPQKLRAQARPIHLRTFGGSRPLSRMSHPQALVTPSATCYTLSHMLHPQKQACHCSQDTCLTQCAHCLAGVALHGTSNPWQLQHTHIQREREREETTTLKCQALSLGVGEDRV
jgi:hypothetical protein